MNPGGQRCGAQSFTAMISHDPASHLFVQIAVVLAFCHALGFICRRMGQPQVVAEMLAGVILGPSLMGLLLNRAIGMEGEG